MAKEASSISSKQYSHKGSYSWPGHQLRIVQGTLYIERLLKGLEQSHYTSGGKKRDKHTGRSDLCKVDVNVRFCTALQLMGVGGKHAAVMAAFLDLPDPHK